MYAGEDDGEYIWINCYDSSEYDKGLRFSKKINKLTDKQTIGHDRNFLTCTPLAPYPLGQERCMAESDRLYIFSNEWDMFTVQQVKPMEYNTIALINRLDDYTALANAFEFIHAFKTVVLVSTSKEQKWLYEASKRIENDDTEVKTVSTEYLKGYTSVNDYFVKNGEDKTKDMLTGLMNDLTEISLPGVVDISTVKAEDDGSTRKYFTMIDRIDSKTGGLSGFWLVTGQTGNGKTEFTMQLSLAVLEQGAKVFYYSGEEKKERFLNKLCLKVVDPRDVDKKPRKLWGNRHSEEDFDYFVNPSCMKDFKAWLKGRYFIYDEVLKGQNIVERIITMLETMHKEKGVTVFFLDNLMTLTTGVKQSDLNQIQGELADALKDFVNDYNVIVVLVAHPKKTADADLKNSDISGTLNVPNLAHVIVTVRRATNEEKAKDQAAGREVCSSYISCTKDRPTGDLFKAGVHFDVINKLFVQGRRPEFSWRQNKLDSYIASANYVQDEFPF